MLYILWLLILFACWGSFLNVVAYRITYDKPFFTKRSYCPSCTTMIAWYDNIPLLSWLILRGKCRSCKHAISLLYPFIELISSITLSALFLRTAHHPLHFFFFFIFFSALIVATRTDLEAMVIPQLFSLWLIPVGLLGAFTHSLNISLVESIVGAVLGYGSLWFVAKTFLWLKKKEGLGEGDMELLALIGAFLGPLGVWFTVLSGSLIGLLIGGTFLLTVKKKLNIAIPFGPFLALGATLFFFFEQQIIALFF